MMMHDFQHAERSKRADDCANRVHHPLKTECPSIGVARHRRSQQRLSDGCSHAAAQSGTRARHKNMPRAGRNAE